MKTKTTIFTLAALIFLAASVQSAQANPIPCEETQEGCIAPLVVTKTAETSFHRDWQWKVRKAANQKASRLTEEQMTAINYKLSVGALPKDKDWQVTGTITITNPEGNPDAKVASLTDVLSGTGDITGAVICDVSLPHLLPAGETITCTYEKSLTSAASQTNTVTVETAGKWGVPGASATAPVTFTTPTTETDRCVTVNDTNANGPQDLEVCANESIKTIKYTSTFGHNELANVYLACGHTDYSNTVSFVTNDTETTGSFTVTSPFHVECPSSEEEPVQ